MRPEIRTDRLTLRSSHPSDFDAMLSIYGRAEVARMVASWPIPPDHDLIRERCNPFPLEDGIVGVVEHEGSVVGTIGVMREDTGIFEMGYGFHPDHWGRGYATEIGRALVDAVFARYDMDRIQAAYFADNPASGRVLEKIGFSRLREEPLYSVARGGEEAGYLYELTRTDWLLANSLYIETERLVIRAYRPFDAPAFQAIADDIDIAKMMMSVPHPMDVDMASEWIAKRPYTGRTGFVAGIFQKDGTLVGNIGIGGEPLSTMYFVGKPYWGQGYASEALSAFMGWAFERYALDQIDAGALVDNPASQRVLEKAGFEKVGEDRCKSMARLEAAPEYVYRLKRNHVKAIK